MRRIATIAALLLTAVSAHAQQKISALPDAGPITGTELVPVVQGGTTSKALASQLATYFDTHLAATGLTINQPWTFAGVSSGTSPTLRLSGTTPQLDFKNNTDRFLLSFESGQSTFKGSFVNASGQEVLKAFQTNGGAFSVWPNFVVNADSSTQPSQIIGSVSPQLGMYKTDGGQNAQKWVLDAATANHLLLKACSDDMGNCGTFVDATRSGPAVTAMTLGHTNATVTTHVGRSIFTTPGAAASGATLALSSSLPMLEITNSSGQPDMRRATFSKLNSGHLLGSLCNDAGTTCNDWLRVLPENGSPSVAAVGFFTGQQESSVLMFLQSGAWSIGGTVPSAGATIVTQDNAPPRFVEQRSGRTAIPSVAAGAFADVTVTWSSAFSNTNYSMNCTAESAATAAAGIIVDHIAARANASATVVVKNGGAAPTTGTLHCFAIHD